MKRLQYGLFTIGLVMAGTAAIALDLGDQRSSLAAAQASENGKCVVVADGRLAGAFHFGSLKTEMVMALDGKGITLITTAPELSRTAGLPVMEMTQKREFGGGVILEPISKCTITLRIKRESKVLEEATAAEEARKSDEERYFQTCDYALLSAVRSLPECESSF